MKFKILISICIYFFATFISIPDTLYTTNNQVYEGKFVAYRYETIYFNVYKFGKVSDTKRFPISNVHKIVFNPKSEGANTPYELKKEYKRLRRGKKSIKINLQANEIWKDTGINVRAEQDILFSITGSIYIKKDHKVFHYGELNVKWDKKKQLPTQPTGAVIAKIGKDGIPFYVGNNRAPFRIKKKGRLYIGINDSNFKDNEGNFLVTIYY